MRKQARERIKFVLRQIAIMYTETGSISALSEEIGLHRNTLNAMLTSGALDKGIPVSVIKAIEEVTGKNTIPREVLNPSVYGWR